MRVSKALVSVGTELPEDVDAIALDHMLDISGSIYTRMKELGMTQVELAKAVGMDAGRLSKIISGRENLTLKTIARFEKALAFRLDAGFSYTAGSAAPPEKEESANSPKHAGWDNVVAFHGDKLKPGESDKDRELVKA